MDERGRNENREKDKDEGRQGRVTGDENGSMKFIRRYGKEVYEIIDTGKSKYGKDENYGEQNMEDKDMGV